MSEIQTRIFFDSQEIVIDRRPIIDKLNNAAQRVLILSGIGGVGKTAVIKTLYDELKEATPFYIFKATEFEIRNINELIEGSSFQDFIESHGEDSAPILVIDSAERLLDLRNTDPFKELLTILIQNNWIVIFTTRDNYLEDLNYQFFEIYKIVPSNINIQNLELQELQSISEKYKFDLPKDSKVLALICNPFYLNEYLKFYNQDKETGFIEFKEKLWNQIIKKGKPAREQCFMSMAFDRANKGQFFISPLCESRVLDDELKKDGILGYEAPGYFITHDIYEEWALEKIIQVEYARRKGNKDFFDRIGSSRPIRRSFRNWLSEKLLLEKEDIKGFIEDAIKDNQTESFWKDEIFVSVLLSDYSTIFFDIFKEELLADNQELLKRLTFLLRIACKEVDDDFFRNLGIKNIDVLSLEYVFTRPKGLGWQVLIKFVHDNLARVGIANINFLLPIIHDWNSKVKEGETTKLSGLIALQFYQWIIKEDVYFRRDDTKDHLLQTIIYGSSEIRNELQEIFELIIKNKWKRHRDPYSDLTDAILTRIEGLAICKTHPKHVLQLADLYWTYTPVEGDHYGHPGIGVEKYYGIEDTHHDYFPASAYQTPICGLLQHAFKDTVDFILAFSNKTVEQFAKSEFAKHEVEEVDIFINEKESVKQYICTRLWCTYRGTQVAPHVLESMHMALEKFFLERGKNTDAKLLQGLLIYLLRNSKSASITGVVASIVLAYPEKTFDVAEILFRTKLFFLYDTQRLVLDQTQKSNLLMLRNSFGSISKSVVYEDERISACDDKHRSYALEHLFLNYQFFISDETNEDEADKRQKVLWSILDDYYKKLPKASEETEDDKVWKLYLARMDRRGMKPTTEKTKDGIIINFNPEIDPELKEYSERAQEKNAEAWEYGSLKSWAAYKIRNDERWRQYEQYENNPQLAVKEVSQIVLKLRTIEESEPRKNRTREEQAFYLFNHTIPADACAVLVRDHFESLSGEEANLCKEIILDFASRPLKANYNYQISDGSQSAISVLPILLHRFPEEWHNIKLILITTLFNDYPVDMAGTGFHAFPIMAIHKLWRTSFDDAQSLLFGYLMFKPKYETLRDNLQKENYKRQVYRLSENELITRFLEKYDTDLQKVRDNKIALDEVGDIRQLDLRILVSAFQMIPPGTDNRDHKTVVTTIVSLFAERLLSRDADDKVDHRVKQGFLEKYAYFVLTSPIDELQGYVQPFLDRFNGSEAIADLFKEFISAEDHLDSYENFWRVWNLFKDKIVDLCKKGDGYWYVDRIIISYLFAANAWKETAAEWHTLKNENRRFFEEIAEKLGHCPSALYAIAKMLNNIGSPYLNDGMAWISKILRNNKDALNSRKEGETVYYLEHDVKKYIYKNRDQIQKTIILKQDVLVVLDALIEKGSVVGYMLRETIL